MATLTVEELINTLETYEAENCVSIGNYRDNQCLEIWDRYTGCTIDTIRIPE